VARPRKYKGVDPFVREDSFITETGKKVTKGDVIKIKGMWGREFKFLNYVTNPKTNVSWIDCIELERGLGCGFRSFYPERVKIIPKKRGKRVKRTRTSEPSG
jgi:hypothetical protein